MAASIYKGSVLWGFDWWADCCCYGHSSGIICGRNEGQGYIRSDDVTCAASFVHTKKTQGMSYAVLAELPPVYGLFCAIAGPMVYSALGTSHHLSIGPVALVSLSLPRVYDILGIYNDDMTDDEASAARVQAAMSISFVAGVSQPNARWTDNTTMLMMIDACPNKYNTDRLVGPECLPSWISFTLHPTSGYGRIY